MARHIQRTWADLKQKDPRRAAETTPDELVGIVIHAIASGQSVEDDRDRSEK